MVHLTLPTILFITQLGISSGGLAFPLSKFIFDFLIFFSWGKFFYLCGDSCVNSSRVEGCSLVKLDGNLLFKTAQDFLLVIYSTCINYNHRLYCISDLAFFHSHSCERVFVINFSRLARAFVLVLRHSFLGCFCLSLARSLWWLLYRFHNDSLFSLAFARRLWNSYLNFSFW